MAFNVVFFGSAAPKRLFFTNLNKRKQRRFGEFSAEYETLRRFARAAADSPRFGENNGNAKNQKNRRASRARDEIFHPRGTLKSR